jgi:hypothetical protein
MSEEKKKYYIRYWIPELKSYVYMTMHWVNGNAEWTTQESHSRVSFVSKEHAETVIKGSKYPKAEAFTDMANRYIEKRKPVSVRLIKTDDWEAIVIDNVLVAEGHRFSTKQILEMLEAEAAIEYVFEDHYDDEDETGIQNAINQYAKDPE